MTVASQHYGFFIEGLTGDPVGESRRGSPGSAESIHRGAALSAPGETHDPARWLGRETGHNGGRASSLSWIEVPTEGISFLTAPAGKPPQVLSQPSEADAPLGMLETVRHERQTYLTLLPDGELRLNGQPVPPVAVLRVGDQVRVGGDWLLHVSRFTRPRIGPAPEEFVGKPCSYCRIEFEATTVSYICPNCGTPAHCESEQSNNDNESEPLECARLMSECHHCHQPIVLKERYEYVPER